MGLLWSKWFIGMKKMSHIKAGHAGDISRREGEIFSFVGLYTVLTGGKWDEYFVVDIWHCGTFSVRQQLASVHFYLQSFIVIRMINISQLESNKRDLLSEIAFIHVSHKRQRFHYVELNSFSTRGEAAPGSHILLSSTMEMESKKSNSVTGWLWPCLKPFTVYLSCH